MSEGGWFIKHLYRACVPYKPKTMFKIIWGRGATPHFQVVHFFMNLAENFSR